MKVTNTILSILIILFMPACLSVDVVKKMVKVDQAYIPTIYYLKQEQGDNAMASMNLLMEEWQALSAAKRLAYLDENWQTAFARIDGLLRKATVALREKDFFWSRCQLENAMFEWNDLRKQYGMSYYVDYLYEFQMAWDVVQETIDDPVLCWLEWQEFEHQVEDANNAWKKLHRRGVEWDVFEVPEQHKRLFQDYKADLLKALEAFNREMKRADREQVAVVSREVTQKFEKLLNLFGNFGAIPVYRV